MNLRPVLNLAAASALLGFVFSLLATVVRPKTRPIAVFFSAALSLACLTFFGLSVACFEYFGSMPYGDLSWRAILSGVIGGIVAVTSRLMFRLCCRLRWWRGV